MSKQELTRLDIIQKVTEKRMKQHQAAEQLTLTTRQIKRLCKTYNEFGAPGLVSKLRGKPSKRCIKLPVKQQIIDIKQLIISTDNSLNNLKGSKQRMNKSAQ